MPTALLVSGFLVLLIVLLMLAVIRQAPGLLLRVLDPPNEPVVVDAGDDADVYRHLHLRPPSRAVRGEEPVDSCRVPPVTSACESNLR